MDDDFYAQWYAARLWGMLPAVYRTLDSPGPADAAGPLQELVNRIGVQAAVLRRSIDRLWTNQSIETCDDWVIPYIGDLLATRIVSCLDARAQRLDVAKTIYYRRRSGTLGLIEELASDIAGHDARAVEFFRRLGRTRHGLDPPLDLTPGLSAFPTSAALLAGPPPPAVIQGLCGPYSRTPAGGYADLRNVLGAGATGTAFDEFAYTADFRRGRQSIGWYDISRLGVVVWWLYAYPVIGGTPVERAGCPGQFTFDPTGRDVPLFAPSSRSTEDFADNWVSPNEWELPLAIRQALWATLPEALYPHAFSIAVGDGVQPPVQPFALFDIAPETGRFRALGAPPAAAVAVSYCFGFSSTVGAGFDPGFLPTLPTPAAAIEVSAGAILDDVLTALSDDATLSFSDSATYGGPLADPSQNAAPPVNLALVAETGARPVLRWTTPQAWTLTGQEGDLILQGLWLQGADLVLAGAWNAVTLQLCTLDPGTVDPQTPGSALSAIDGVALRPNHIYIDGQVATLTITNCITGPIIAREGGFAALVVSDSIIQAIDVAPAFQIVEPGPQPRRPPLRNLDPVSDEARDVDEPAAVEHLHWGPPLPPPHPVFGLPGPAIQADAGVVALSRTTVLGKLAVHQLSASECILDDVATVEKPQAGCVRFSTLAAGHNLHAPYRCATVPPVSGVFMSRAFGDPNFARVSAGADLAILADPAAIPAPSVLYGASNGAQPGAFCAERQALTQRGLAHKLEEYTPIGLTPVWVDADLDIATAGGTP